MCVSAGVKVLYNKIERLLIEVNWIEWIPVIGCISFWSIGFAFGWSEGNALIGWHHFALADLPSETYSLALRQLIFANTASTRVNGALAERLNLPSYFLHAVLLTGSFRCY